MNLLSLVLLMMYQWLFFFFSNIISYYQYILILELSEKSILFVSKSLNETTPEYEGHASTHAFFHTYTRTCTHRGRKFNIFVYQSTPTRRTRCRLRQEVRRAKIIASILPDVRHRSYVYVFASSYPTAPFLSTIFDGDGRNTILMPRVHVHVCWR